MHVLDNPEVLMAHAQASGDVSISRLSLQTYHVAAAQLMLNTRQSIAGQRLRFMRQLCGFDEKHDDNPSSGSSARGNKSRRVSDRVNR